MEMPNLSDGDVISACISKDFFMKAPDESSIMKDFPENATEWIATGGKRCTDDTVITITTRKIHMQLTHLVSNQKKK